MRIARTMIVGLGVLAAASAAHAQLRVASWNLTEYGGEVSRTAAFEDSLFLSFAGRIFAPDVIILQEVETAAAAQAFRTLMDEAPGSPGDYALATFVNGNDSDSACVYRDTRLTLVGTTVAVTGGGAGMTVRNVMRYQFRPLGYASAGATLYLYSGHLKAGGPGGVDQDRRAEEGVLVRSVLNALPAGSRFIFGGDFNMYSSSEPAWTTLTGSQADNDGRLFDPINRAGNWHIGAAFASVHTQSPGCRPGDGGMDDRFDFLLLSDALSSGQGLSYIGNRAIPFGSGWNDPNHSFRVWGNDATSFNDCIEVTANAMVGPVIAQALIDHFEGTSSPPHLPIFMDLRVPARAAVSVASIDFGTVALGSVAQQSFTITNSASVATFSKDGTGFGIDGLTYSLMITAGFTVIGPAGPFEEPADAAAAGNLHTIQLDTSTVGPRMGTLTIASDDPDAPLLVLNLTGSVVSAADYDVNNDGEVTIEDLYAWHVLATDVDGNGVVNNADRAALLYELRRLETADVTSGRR